MVAPKRPTSLGTDERTRQTRKRACWTAPRISQALSLPLVSNCSFRTQQVDGPDRAWRGRRKERSMPKGVHLRWLIFAWLR